MADTENKKKSKSIQFDKNKTKQKWVPLDTFPFIILLLLLLKRIKRGIYTNLQKNPMFSRINKRIRSHSSIQTVKQKVKIEKTHCNSFLCCLIVMAMLKCVWSNLCLLFSSFTIHFLSRANALFSSFVLLLLAFAAAFREKFLILLTRLFTHFGLLFPPPPPPLPPFNLFTWMNEMYSPYTHSVFTNKFDKCLLFLFDFSVSSRCVCYVLVVFLVSKQMKQMIHFYRVRTWLGIFWCRITRQFSVFFLFSVSHLYFSLSSHCKNLLSLKKHESSYSSAVFCASAL